MFAVDDIVRIRTRLLESRKRVIVVPSADGPLLVKGQRPPRNPIRYALLDTVALVSGMPMLRAAPAYGGFRAQQIEATRLRALRAAGVAVPRLLHEAEDFLVMEYLGNTSLTAQLRDDPTQALRWWKCGLETIAAAQARGQYLSQAFTRNFLVTGTSLAMIDFEDDPLEVMALPDAQARDWLIYLHSSAWRLCLPPAVTSAALLTVLANVSRDVCERLDAAATRLAWLRFLPQSRHLLGCGAVRLQASADLLQTCHACAWTPRAAGNNAEHSPPPANAQG